MMFNNVGMSILMLMLFTPLLLLFDQLEIDPNNNQKDNNNANTKSSKIKAIKSVIAL